MHHFGPSKRFGMVVLGLVLIVVVSISTTLVVEHIGSYKATATNQGIPSLAGNDPVGADFAAYVQAQGGTTTLGQAITPELPNGQQVTQLFQAFMLCGSIAPNATIAPQPIVRQLIQAHSSLPLVQKGNLAYADLVKSSASTAWVRAPQQWKPGGNPAQTGIFVSLGTRSGAAVGHYIPPLFASFLINLNNWQSLLGEPLTEALNVPIAGSSLDARLQAFANAMLVALPDAGKTLTVSFHPAGVDWLTVFGRPKLQLTPQTAIRVTTATQIHSSPGGAMVATFTTPFAATLAGDALWQGTTLWEHIDWRNLLETRDGWVSADDVAFGTAGSSNAESADVDALSPQLAAYVNQLGDNVAMAVYVPAQHRYYTFDANRAMETASTIKIVILVTLLNQVESQGRSLTADEQAEAAAMIEVSDNDAAQNLYDEEGGNDAIAGYMASIGINDLGLTLNGFGTFTMPPTSMIQLLEDLRTASILTPDDCQYVLDLMANVSSDEQMGLGDTAPPGATVQLKDGYGVEDDGLNVMVTVGILTYHDQVYDVAVFTRREQNEDQGTTYVNTICQDVALALLGEK